MFHLAWRNLWRNHRRTIITMSALSLCLGFLIAVDSLINGYAKHTISGATNLSVGEIQIHHPDYLTEHSFYDTVENTEEILAALEERGIPASARSFGYGLVAAGTKSAGAQFWGVEPARERIAFDMAKHVMPGMGAFLTDDARGKMVLGKKLAKTLHATVGTEIVVVVQAADGSLGNEIYEVAGILKSIGDSFDRGGALIHREDFERLFVSGGRIHEIAVNSRGAMELPALDALVTDIAGESNETKTWRELLPMLSDFMANINSVMWIFLSIFLIAAGIGVMNTMVMATHERIHEFGVTKALGATNGRIFRDVAAEAVLMGLLSTSIGLALGLAGAWYLQVHGIDTSRWAGDLTFGGVAFSAIWRGAIRVESVLVPTLMMWAICFLASLYPAFLMIRLNPVQAISSRL